MTKQTKISLWLYKDLIPLFRKLNYKVNKPFFEHHFRLFFHIYGINYINPYWGYKIIPESFKDSEQAMIGISQIIITMKAVNKQIKHLEETLNFLAP